MGWCLLAVVLYVDSTLTIFTQNSVDILRHYGAGAHCKQSMSVFIPTQKPRSINVRSVDSTSNIFIPSLTFLDHLQRVVTEDWKEAINMSLPIWKSTMHSLFYPQWVPLKLYYNYSHRNSNTRGPPGTCNSISGPLPIDFSVIWQHLYFFPHGLFGFSIIFFLPPLG